MEIRSALLIILGLGINLFSKAQVSYGIQAGMCISGLEATYPGYTVSSDRIVSLTAGMPVEIRFSRQFALQPELNYITKGGKQSASGYYYNNKYSADIKVKFHYFEVPVLAKFTIGNGNTRLDLFAGPAFAYGLNVSQIEEYMVNGVTYDHSSSRSFEDYEINRFDFSFDFGISATFLLEVNKLFLNLTYETGITNMDNSEPDPNITSNSTKTVNDNLLFRFGYLYLIKPKIKK